MTTPKVAAKPTKAKKPVTRTPARRTAPKGATPPVTTGDTLMKLRALLTERTGQPWHAVAKVNPVDFENPTSPFVVAARLPGGNEWVGQWPADVDEATLAAIAEEVIAVQASALAALQAATQPEIDEEGNVLSDPRVVGKIVPVTLANGKTVSVVPRRDVPAESEASQDARLRRELDAFPTVAVEVPERTFVSWNGLDVWIESGFQNVPLPYADILRGARRDCATPLLDMDSRRAAGLPPIPQREYLDGYLDRENVAPVSR